MIRVKAAFFSLTPPAPPDDDGSYLRWHLLDHMVEQYQLPGIQYALRYIADGDYLEHRIVADRPPAGRRQRRQLPRRRPGAADARRLHAARPSPRRDGPVPRGPTVAAAAACPRCCTGTPRPQPQISPEVVPFRPHRGVVVIVEEPAGDDVASWLQWLHTDHYPAVLAAPGVAGAWMYGTTNTWKLHPATQGDPQYITVIYLDDDPLAATKALAPLVEERWRSGAVRPLFAGPLRTMIEWEAWRA